MKTPISLIIGTAISLSFALQAPASEPASPPAADTPTHNPACAEAKFRDFDFWIGTWDVTTPQGQVAGTNRITMEEGGCLLVERWTGAGGGTGQSYNFVDRDTGQWRQVWVSPGFTIDYSGGLDDSDAMVLEGRIAYATSPENNGRSGGAGPCKRTAQLSRSFISMTPTVTHGCPGSQACIRA